MSSAEARMLREAMACIDDDDLDGALVVLDAILEQNPRSMHALLNKGAVLQNLGMASQAISCYDMVLEMAPRHTDALLNKGAALHAEGRYADAISCYDQILQNNGVTPLALLYKGLSLGEMGNLDDAIRHFDDALLLDGDLDIARVSKETARELLASGADNGYGKDAGDNRPLQRPAN